MLLGALIDAGAGLKEIHNILQLIPQHFPRCKSLKLDSREVLKNGFRACSAEFTISETEDETKAEAIMQSTRSIAKASNLSERAKTFALAAIQILVEVESSLHGVEMSTTHLHEAGSSDTLADVFGIAAASDSLKIFEGEVFATPVAVGGGSVSFSHGTIATPAPAVLEIARRRNIPIVGGPEMVELATPTGMSILASITTKFLETYPAIIPQKVGYGAGKKGLVKAPNFMRVVLGQPINSREGNQVQVVETNLDDVPGDILGHTLQLLLESGAKDAWVTPALFKKGRPGYVLHAICDSHEAEKIADVMFEETGTLGVRFQQWDRFTLEREVKKVRVEISGKAFEVRIKFARDNSGKIVRAKPEFEDLKSIAKSAKMPLRGVAQLVMRELTQGQMDD